MPSVLSRGTTNWAARRFRLALIWRRIPIITRPIARGSWGFPFHDVVNLLGVDGLVLHERIRH